MKATGLPTGQPITTNQWIHGPTCAMAETRQGAWLEAGRPLISAAASLTTSTSSPLPTLSRTISRALRGTSKSGTRLRPGGRHPTDFANEYCFPQNPSCYAGPVSGNATKRVGWPIRVGGICIGCRQLSWTSHRAQVFFEPRIKFAYGRMIRTLRGFTNATAKQPNGGSGSKLTGYEPTATRRRIMITVK